MKNANSKKVYVLSQIITLNQGYGSVDDDEGRK